MIPSRRDGIIAAVKRGSKEECVQVKWRRAASGGGSFRSEAQRTKRIPRKSCGASSNWRAATAADIAVIPTASLVRETGPRYEHLFSEMGARSVVTSLDFDTRRDAEEPGRLERLRQATGVFFTGGNQLRLSTLIGGTPVAKAVRQLNAAGVPVAGTSAGAAFLCEHMIAFGDEGSTPVAGSVRLGAGSRGHQSVHHRPAFPAA